MWIDLYTYICQNILYWEDESTWLGGHRLLYDDGESRRLDKMKPYLVIMSRITAKTTISLVRIPAIEGSRSWILEDMCKPASGRLVTSLTRIRSESELYNNQFP